MDHYTVAGKTGTAQKPNSGGAGRYSEDKFVSSFVGFYPATDPRLLISVMLDEPRNGHTGAEAAAPSFKAIAERAGNYLNITPDIQPAGEESPVSAREPSAVSAPLVPGGSTHNSAALAMIAARPGGGSK